MKDYINNFTMMQEQEQISILLKCLRKVIALNYIWQEEFFMESSDLPNFSIIAWVRQ